MRTVKSFIDEVLKKKDRDHEAIVGEVMDLMMQAACDEFKYSPTELADSEVWQRLVAHLPERVRERRLEAYVNEEISNKKRETS